MFHQDFELLPPTRARQATQPAAPSLDPTQLLSSSFAKRAAFSYAHSAPTSSSALSNQRASNQRLPTRPPVPLFHSNSTGNLSAQQIPDPSELDMGGAGKYRVRHVSPLTSDLTPVPANVAYHDTMDDLSFEGGANFGDFNMFTDFTAVNTTGAGDVATVSPKDLMNGDSVPPSTAFTNLTTPGSTYLETPDSYQASPLFNDGLNTSFDFSANGNINNFFPELDSLVSQPMDRATSASSFANQIVIHPGGSLHNRKQSSASGSPATFVAVRPSSVAGVGAKKRDKPLPPILVDESDTVALKRARNTAAARKSRARKVEERDTLETRIARLEAELSRSETEKAQLSDERDYWKARADGIAD